MLHLLSEKFDISTLIILNITIGYNIQVAKYMKNNYDEIKVRVEKGKREIIKAAAEQAGESLNGYIKKAVDQRMERDNA